MRITFDPRGPAPTLEEAAAIVAALHLATEAGPAPAPPRQLPPRWALGDRAPALLDPWLDSTVPGTAWRLSGR